MIWAYVLLAAGLALFVQLLEYIFAVHWYRKNPEKEKTQYFEQLDTVYRIKWLKWLSAALGAVLIVCGVIMLIITH